ncbi:MAG: hypothetical protein KGQ75_01755 [Sphingomonadales bacterium]|nr:hypothetical protein [Sphingomonadales bacterium]
MIGLAGGDAKKAAAGSPRGLAFRDECLDANLLNEIEILDIIHNRTGEKKKVNIFDPLTGELITEMVVTSWQQAPMAQSQLRNYRTVSIELMRTSTVE